MNYNRMIIILLIVILCFYNLLFFLLSCAGPRLACHLRVRAGGPELRPSLADRLLAGPELDVRFQASAVLGGSWVVISRLINYRYNLYIRRLITPLITTLEPASRFSGLAPVATFCGSVVLLVQSADPVSIGAAINACAEGPAHGDFRQLRRILAMPLQDLTGKGRSLCWTNFSTCML